MISPEQVEVIESIIESKLIEINIGLPCIVENVDIVNKTVDVSLQIKRVIENTVGDMVTEKLPKLDAIPIGISLTSEGYFFSLPIKTGCYGRVVFLDTDIGIWRELGRLCSPGDIGRFKLNGGVFKPDLNPKINSLLANTTDDLVLGKDNGTQLRCKTSTIEITTGGALAASDFVAMSTAVKTMWNALKTACDVFVPPGTPDGGAALAIALSTAIATALETNIIASTNLKAD